MKRALSLVWRFKWIPVCIILIELALYLPVLFLIHRFGESSFAYNLSQTPLGSSEFIGLFFDSMKLDETLSNAFLVFAVLLPVIFLVKLALTAGTFSVMQNDNRHLRVWLSAAGEYLLKSVGLFLRWLIVPVILLLIPALLTIPKISWLSGIALVLMGLGWFMSLSILNHAFIILVRDEKKSLRKALTVFKSNFMQVVGAIVLLLVPLAIVHWLSVQSFQFTSNPEFGAIGAILVSIIIALALRFVVLLWQAQHVRMAEQHERKVLRL